MGGETHRRMKIDQRSEDPPFPPFSRLLKTEETTRGGRKRSIAGNGGRRCPVCSRDRGGGHDPEKNPEKKNRKEGKPMPNHRIERQERHPAMTDARVHVEEWEEGPQRKGE